MYSFIAFSVRNGLFTLMSCKTPIDHSLLMCTDYIQIITGYKQMNFCSEQAREADFFMVTVMFKLFFNDCIA